MGREKRRRRRKTENALVPFKRSPSALERRMQHHLQTMSEKGPGGFYTMPKRYLTQLVKDFESSGYNFPELGAAKNYMATMVSRGGKRKAPPPDEALISTLKVPHVYEDSSSTNFNTYTAPLRMGMDPKTGYSVVTRQPIEHLAYDGTAGKRKMGSMPYSPENRLSKISLFGKQLHWLPPWMVYGDQPNQFVRTGMPVGGPSGLARAPQGAGYVRPVHNASLPDYLRREGTSVPLVNALRAVQATYPLRAPLANQFSTGPGAAVSAPPAWVASTLARSGRPVYSAAYAAMQNPAPAPAATVRPPPATPPRRVRPRRNAPATPPPAAPPRNARTSPPPPVPPRTTLPLLVGPPVPPPRSPPAPVIVQRRRPLPPLPAAPASPSPPAAPAAGGPPPAPSPPATPPSPRDDDDDDDDDKQPSTGGVYRTRSGRAVRRVKFTSPSQGGVQVTPDILINGRGRLRPSPPHAPAAPKSKNPLVDDLVKAVLKKRRNVIDDDV